MIVIFMKKAIYLKLFFTIFISLCDVNARPVSYADGWTVMLYNDYHSNSLLTHYSPTSKYSTGYLIQYWQDKEYWINALNLNYLANRINKKHSQTNLYFKGGLGILKTDFNNYSNKNELVTYAEIAADWETRRYFTSYNNNFLKSVSVDGTFIQKVRLGYAPYIAKYGALHTWLMYELNHMPENLWTVQSTA